MKLFLLFIIFFILGFGGTLFLVNTQTSQEVTKPKAKTPIESTKFSIENPPSTSLHGDITLLSGEVKWQSRIASEASTITLKQQIKQGESLFTDTTGKVSIAFPDMLFELSPDTTLNIIQTLPSSTVLEQPKGKIGYQTSSSTPLAIRTYPILTESLGGNFSISIDEDDGTIVISVESGSVAIAYNDSDTISTVHNVKKGETLIFDPSTRTSAIE